MSEAVPSTPDFVSIEAQVIERWRRDRVSQRSLDLRKGAPEVTFYEGPPTANGRPGVHHVWARVYKDLFCRFQTMRGHLVERRAGWDTHGLPVEVEVEKALGLSGKRQIEELGIEAFTQQCRESVQRYVADWERLTERIGFWVDTADAYWTLSPDYVQSVWWHLRELWDAGLLYEDLKVVPYCPRCGTALSSHELGQPDVYREVTDLAAYVRLPLEPPAPAEALVVWTTTPWTLPSNTGVAVHPELTYAVVDGLVVAEPLVEAVFGEGAVVSHRLAGSELVGLRYRRPLEVIEVDKDADGWRVVPADFVTTDEGTGLVHLAPGFGEVDRVIGRTHDLPQLNPVGPDGRFVDSAGWLAGLPVKEADARIVDELEARGLLVRAGPYQHSYPHCWRCSTPLLYWGKPSWYIATSTKTSELLSANEGVGWRPEHIRHGRFGEWLANNIDWALSRDRYWGTPLPIWRCPGGHTRCIGSLGELGELVGRDVNHVDPHRPAIDEVTFTCPDCGGEAQRIEAVIDAWFDSGSMPAAQWGYPWTPGSSERLRIPADFVLEAIDQTRGWFYSLLAINVLVFGKAPYRHVVVLGHIIDADGRKMSKSLGNVIDPWLILDSRGADPLRWWMFSQGSPWTSTRISLDVIDASTREVLLTLWNTWSFFSTYARINRFGPADSAIPAPSQRSPLDRWARSRLHRTVTEVTVGLDTYYPHQAATAIGRLVDDVSNWYVRRSRRRFWRTDPGADLADSLAAHATLHEVLTGLASMLAPFCPHLADFMWRHLMGVADDDPTSVHLSDWLTPDQAALDDDLEACMDLVRCLSSLGRAARAEAGIKLRQPLGRAIVVLPPASPKVLTDLLADELNVDEIVVADTLADIASFDLVPNFRLLGPRLGPAVQEVRSALAALDSSEVVATLEAGQPVRVELSNGPQELSSDEVEVRVRPQEGFAVSRAGFGAVALDVTITEELRIRGLTRDVIRQVQELRRHVGLEVDDRVRLTLAGVDEIRPRSDEVAEAVLAVELTFGIGASEGTPLAFDDARPATAWLSKA